MEALQNNFIERVDDCMKPLDQITKEINQSEFESEIPIFNFVTDQAKSIPVWAWHQSSNP